MFTAADLSLEHMHTEIFIESQLIEMAEDGYGYQVTG
jgi:hypothetical protein